MNMFVRAVASLIATFFLFLGSAQVQAQQQIDLRRFFVEEHISTISGQVTGYQYLFLPDDGVVRPGLGNKTYIQFFTDIYAQAPVEQKKHLFTLDPDWSLKVWKLNADGTAPVGTTPVHLFYVPSSDSLALAVKGMTVPELTGTNEDVLEYLQRHPSTFVDQGAMFAVRLPIRYSLPGIKGRACQTGTRELYTSFNGVSHLFFSNWTDLEFANDFRNSWSNAIPESDLYENAGMMCVPGEVKAVWVVNEAPQGAKDDPNDFPDLGIVGNYLSRFTLDTVNWQESQRVDVVVSGSSRSISFDDSRDTAYMPRTSFRTFAAKSAAPTVENVATVPDSRIAVAVHEKTGDVFHLAGSSYGNRVFVYSPKTHQVWDFIPMTSSTDKHLQGAIFGNMFVRVIGVSENGTLSATKVEVYDIPSRMQRASYVIGRQLANSGQVFGLRPEISFDPRTNYLWIASQFEGTLGYLDFNTGVYTDVPISQESGIAVGATDVEVDTSRNRLYVSIAKFRSGWFGASTPYVDGALWELDLATKQVERQITLRVYPWSVAILPTQRGTFIAVTNNATVSGNNTTVPSTLSIVDTTNFVEVARLQTQNQPTVMAVDFKD